MSYTCGLRRNGGDDHQHNTPVDTFQRGNPPIYPFRDPRTGMVEETTGDPVTETDCPNPVALSIAGGAVGTITGLKRGGIPGAITGGLVGGTVGYVSGAVSGDPTTVVENPPTDSDPISIDPTEDTATETAQTDDADDDEDGHADEHDDSTDNASDDADHESDA